MQQWSDGTEKIMTANRISSKVSLANAYCDSLAAQAEQLCQDLRAYRSKLATTRLQNESTGAETSHPKNTNIPLSVESSQKVRSELEATLKAMTGQMPSSKHSPDDNPRETTSGDTLSPNTAVRKDSDSQDMDMEKLLDRYSERLAGMLDERIAAGAAKTSVARSTTDQSQPSPRLEKPADGDDNDVRRSEGDHPGAAGEMKQPAKAFEAVG